MAHEFKFPDVGEGIAEGKLIKWLVKEGDEVKEDDNLAEVETDKAVVEIPAPASGKIEKLLYNEGDTIDVGDVFIVIDDGKDGAPNAEVKEEHESPKEVRQPELSRKQDTRTKGIKATPKVRKEAREKGIDLSEVKGTGPSGRITMEDLGKPEKREEKTAAGPTGNVLATPSVRKLAREMDIDITQVKGTGPNDHITAEDVRGFSGSKQSSVSTEHLHAKPKEDDNKEQPPEQPMSKIRTAIAKRMMESVHNTAQYTTHYEADVTDLVAIREKEKVKLKEQGIKLTYLPFIMKACIVALKEYPNFNATVDIEDNKLVRSTTYNIGIATDTSEGLLVPVLKNVDKKSIADLATELGSLASRAREQKLTLEDMTQGSFTITSIGNASATFFTPILNYPQVAILGIGKIQEKPAVSEGNVAIRKFAPLSLTCDHRVLDGADAARFMNTLVRHLEDPDLLFMEMM